MICINNWNPNENPLIGFLVSIIIVSSPLFIYHSIKTYKFLFSKKIKMIYWGGKLINTQIILRPTHVQIKEHSILLRSLAFSYRVYANNKINLRLIQPEISNIFKTNEIYCIYFKYGFRSKIEDIELYSGNGKNIIKEIDKLIEEWTR